eukprot:CAMPEP_0171640668 /NCGR_PEP_ID=MMETSP0990-20121206/30646_1 /TAXON_ID=483369 /ORGANISM="non described non described, Strain CCMP2098" /LENGTH=80 /DNA_ID=CAMNT_0012215041 /DNA_START=20 /DNA_END=259 /DNA_ORIENTATION=-
MTSGMISWIFYPPRLRVGVGAGTTFAATAAAVPWLVPAALLVLAASGASAAAASAAVGADSFSVSPSTPHASARSPLMSG